MSDDAAKIAIPKEFLCRRCNHCGDHLRPDGKVDCTIAEAPVQPVERKEYVRFENCPQRSDFSPLPGYKLRLLASFARRIGRREGHESVPDRVERAEQLIRADLRITAKLRAT